MVFKRERGGTSERSPPVAGFHMTSLKFKLQTIDPTEILDILLSWCISAAENYFQTNFPFKRVLGFVI